jgi:tail tube protein
MMGNMTTTGPTETVVYTHTGTIANLFDKMLTVQVGRADESGTLRPWTYEGGKVTDWEFSNSVDQTLRCSIGMDFEKESNADAPAGVYVLQTNTPVTGADVLSAAGGVITYGGSSIEVDDLSIKVDNALNTDRYYINQAQAKKQPIQDGKRMIDVSFKTSYVNNDFWEKVSSTTIAGSYAQLVATWSGLTLLGSTIFPNLKVTIPVLRMDEGGPTVDGPGMLEQSFSAKGLYDGTNSAVTVAYQSADVTQLPN